MHDKIRRQRKCAFIRPYSESQRSYKSPKHSYSMRAGVVVVPPTVTLMREEKVRSERHRQ